MHSYLIYQTVNIMFNVPLGYDICKKLVSNGEQIQTVLIAIISYFLELIWLSSSLSN